MEKRPDVREDRGNPKRSKPTDLERGNSCSHEGMKSTPARWGGQVRVWLRQTSAISLEFDAIELHRAARVRFPLTPFAFGCPTLPQGGIQPLQRDRAGVCCLLDRQAGRYGAGAGPGVGDVDGIPGDGSGERLSLAENAYPKCVIGLRPVHNLDP